jgi:hypothetical protein
MQLRTKLVIAAMALSLIASVAGIGYLGKQLMDSRQVSERVEDQLKKEQELGKFVLDLMAISRANISDIKKQILAQAIVRVAGNIFENEDHKRYFAVLVAIESKFDVNAKLD